MHYVPTLRARGLASVFNLFSASGLTSWFPCTAGPVLTAKVALLRRICRLSCPHVCLVGNMH